MSAVVSLLLDLESISILVNNEETLKIVLAFNRNDNYI